MSNSIKSAMTNAAGFHEDSVTDSHDIDNSGTIVVPHGAGINEEADFEAAAATQDANGTAPSENSKLHTGTGSKSPSPFWLFNDFKWVMGTNQGTGETYWNLSPLADRVNYVALNAPDVLTQAYDGLSDEDKVIATQFGATLRDTCVEAEQINSWLENTAIYAFAKECGRNACSAVKWTEAQGVAAGRDNKKLAGEHEVRAQEAGRNAAILKLALITAAPTVTVNYKAAAWDLFKQDAFRQSKQFMNPDEERKFNEAKNASSTAGGFKLKSAS